MKNILSPVTKKAGRIIAEPLDLGADPEAVAWLTSQRELPAILETLQFAEFAGRFSVFAADPLRVVSCGPPVCDSISKFVSEAKAGPEVEPSPCEIPYAGGWIGHISYEAGVPARLVQGRCDDAGIPLLHFGLYDHALILDQQTDQWWATAIEWPEGSSNRVSAAKRIAMLHEQLKEAGAIELPGVPDCVEHEASTAVTKTQFKAKVRRIKKYIEAGDIYQANLAQRFCVETELAPFDLYRRVRRRNPGPYAAYLSRANHAIVSASPELFLDLRASQATTRPIKGTRPRSGNGSTDALQCEELCTSPKEISELNMIIDLLRNDLGRVCEHGSVKVVHAGTLESHPTVFHRVATIEGRIAPGKNWSSLLEAAFPCGSIVGAPKIRAMQIIRELEPFTRGPYCGAIGYIGLDGHMTLNVAIRTMVCRKGTVNVFAGAGIVAESDPDAEYEEVLTKASGLLSSVGLPTEPWCSKQGQEAELALHE